MSTQRMKWLGRLLLVSIGAFIVLAALPVTPKSLTMFFANLPLGPALGEPPAPTSAAPSRRNSGGSSLPASPALASSPLNPQSPTQQENPALREYMLELINADRAAAGLAPVALGSNGAAQRHTDNMKADCFISHWGLDGLKPYMRYSQFGGDQYSSENVLGLVECPENRRPGNGRDSPGDFLLDSLKQAEAELMKSPGHRKNILNPNHKKVSLGISCDQFGDCWVAQLFQGDYVTFTALPEISLKGQLTMSFSLRNQARWADDSMILVWFEELPHPLTLGQLDRTCAYRVGQIPILFIRPPAPEGVYYPEDSASYSWELGPDPYTMSNDLPRTTATDCPSGNTHTSNVPIEDASESVVRGRELRVEADIGGYLAEYGPGVYTLMVWALGPNGSFPAIVYPLFVDFVP